MGTILYLISFFALIFVVSVVSTIIENKAARHTLREIMKSFLGTTSGMLILALIAYLLSR